MRDACPVKPPLEQLRALLPTLVQKVPRNGSNLVPSRASEWLTCVTARLRARLQTWISCKTVSGSQKVYNAYKLTPSGARMLPWRGGKHASPNVVPSSTSGAKRPRDDGNATPTAELRRVAARGPLSSALLHWRRTLDRWRARGQSTRAQAHEHLHTSLVAWRTGEAARLGAAPPDVLTDDGLISVALVPPSLSSTR